MSIVDEPLLTAAELEAQFSENALTVLSRRYLRKDENGELAESLGEMFRRVAHHVSQAEIANGDPQAAEDFFYRLLTRLRFVPNSPTFTGAGTPLGQLAACFVLPIADDMGKKPGGIFQSLRDAALIQQTGGGNGFSFSRLRPKESLVLSSMGQATGPVGFLRVYDRAFGEILIFTEQGLLRLDEIIKHNKPGWHDHKLMVATDNGERLSTQGYNNGMAPVLRVVTDEGLELTGTHEHKVKVMTGDGPVWRRLDELQPGDAVLVKLSQHKGRFMALQQPTSQHGNQVLPEFPPILDKEFAFFLGYLIGDGFIAGNKSDHRIGVSVALDSYLLEEIPALIKRIFGEQINVHRQQKSDDASVTFVVYNRAIKDFLRMNKLDKAKSTQACVPRLIRQSPPKIVGAFLRGLFEADGSVSHGYPMLLSSSESLIREVAVLLIGLGCPVRISKQPLTDSHYGLAPMWRIRIHSHVGLDCWKSRISCDPHSRFNICHSFQPDLGRESSYPLPHPEYWISPVLDAITLSQIDKRERGNSKNFRATLPALRRKLLRYMRLDRRFTHSSYTQLADQYTEFKEYARPIDGYWFVTVQAVEGAGNALTLDIEVDSNHTYLAGGWVTHNSRRGANMAVLRVDHPDIAEFVTCKTSEDAITNFNISVGMLDDFRTRNGR
jgi:ribonucleoside-diphosphate reductase alpha chain